MCGMHPGSWLLPSTLGFKFTALHFSFLFCNGPGTGDGVLVCETCQGQGIVATKVS